MIYSLIWKKIESPKETYPSSLFNAKIAVFHIMTFILVFLDCLWHVYYLMFLSQIILFIFASIMSYSNYKKRKQHKFPKFYFIAMLLSLTAWVLNALAPLCLNWNQGILMDVYIINTIIFLLILYGVVKVTK